MDRYSTHFEELLKKNRIYDSFFKITFGGTVTSEDGATGLPI